MDMGKETIVVCMRENSNQSEAACGICENYKNPQPEDNRGIFFLRTCCWGFGGKAFYFFLEREKRREEKRKFSFSFFV